MLDSLVRELLTEVNDYDLCITEFLRVVDQLLPAKSFYRLCPELHHHSRTPSGTRVRVQLLGQYPQWLAENAARAVELGSWGVDLNCGCPSKLVNGSGGGATLLKDPELIYRGAKAMREAVPDHLPVTVKVRLGWDSGERRFEIADAVQAGGRQRAGGSRTHPKKRLQGGEHQLAGDRRDPPPSDDPGGGQRRNLGLAEARRRAWRPPAATR
nr:tRNA-dihydrouridine synthase C [Raoultella sp. NCTC 9187]